MQKKLHIKKGDTVMVISGESKGQKGRVLNVDRAKAVSYTHLTLPTNYSV